MNSPRYDIVCIDIKSFYASLECVERNLNPLTAKLCVVGDLNRDGSVCLASSPVMKKQYGIKTGSRLYEIKKINDPDILVVQSRMAHYLDMSKAIVALFLRYVPETHLHVYSVDESWLTLTGNLKELTPFELTRAILNDIYNTFGLIACAGIGDNKFLAKCILDAEGKKQGIAECRIEDIPVKLHPLPIEEMWGVGSQLKKRFNEIGILTFRDLAFYDQRKIQKTFGKSGLVLQQYANGIDYSPVVYQIGYHPDSVFGFDSGLVSFKKPKNIGRGITLLEPRFDTKDVLLVIYDLVDEVCEELRKHELSASKVHLSIVYSNKVSEKSFSRQKTYKTPSNLESEIYERCKKLYFQFHKENEEVRMVQVSVGLLEADVPFLLDEIENREREVAKVKDEINQLFGKGTVRRAASFQHKSIAPDRSKKTKGHY